MKKTRFGGKLIEVTRTEWNACIYDGHSHIDRRVYEDKDGARYVVINGLLWDISCELRHYDIDLAC